MKIYWGNLDKPQRKLRGRKSDSSFGLFTLCIRTTYGIFYDLKTLILYYSQCSYGTIFEKLCGLNNNFLNFQFHIKTKQNNKGNKRFPFFIIDIATQSCCIHVSYIMVYLFRLLNNKIMWIFYTIQKKTFMGIPFQENLQVLWWSFLCFLSM